MGENFMGFFVVCIVIAVGLIAFAVVSGSKTRKSLDQKLAGNATYEGPRNDVVIKSVGPKKLDVIKCVIDATGCSLRDGKNIVEGYGIIKALPSDTAKELVSKLQGVGAEAELR